MAASWHASPLGCLNAASALRAPSSVPTGTGRHSTQQHQANSGQYHKHFLMSCCGLVVRTTVSVTMHVGQSTGKKQDSETPTSCDVAKAAEPFER